MIENKNSPGFFISFEGIDGAGKSTHISWFASLIQERYPHKQVIVTREPGGTPLGESLREILLNEEMNLETECLLMFAARREHLSKVIEPALAKGYIVISDRFTDATFAYQAGGRGVSIKKLAQLETWVQGRQDKFGSEYLVQPNLTFLFDLPGEIAEKRRSNARSPDKFEKLDLDFFEKVRQEYLRRASEDSDRFLIIDSLKSIDQIKALLEKVDIGV